MISDYIIGVNLSEHTLDLYSPGAARVTVTLPFFFIHHAVRKPKRSENRTQLNLCHAEFLEESTEGRVLV